jgi:hypothetical protein
MRLLSAAALFAGLATLEPLVLGLVRWGANGFALCSTSVGLFVLGSVAVPRADPPLTAQIRHGWASAPHAARALLGAVAALAILWTGYLLTNPFLGSDAETYHLAEPGMWLHNGRPGSMVVTHVGLPVHAYPRGAEVLYTWFIAMARTPVALDPVMVALALLLVTATFLGLRQLGAEPLTSALAGVSLLLIPISWTEIAGPDTDLVALVWLMTAAALCVGALAEPGLFWLGLLAAGLAVGTKTTTAFLAAVLVLVTLTFVRRRLMPTWRLSLIGFAGVVLGVCWPTENLIIFGAPIYPFSSFPAGPPVPPVISTFGASFLSNPSGAIRVAGYSGYGRAGAGGLILVASLVPLGIWAAIHMARRSGSPGRDKGSAAIVLALLALAIAELVLWGSSPFTGWSGHPGAEPLVLAGLRYLLPGFAPGAIALALASRERRLRLWSIAGLGLAVGADLWRGSAIGYPYRPTGLVILAVLVGGALLGLAVRLSLSRPSALARWNALLWAPLPFALIALAVPSSTYLSRHLAVSARTKVDQTALLRWLAAQPGWAHGDAPVFVGPDADVTLMGAHFQHPLALVDAGTPCAVVRTDATHGWLIITWVPNGGVFQIPYPTEYCALGLTPAYRSGLTVVYGPADLLASR